MVRQQHASQELCIPYLRELRGEHCHTRDVFDSCRYHLTTALLRMAKTITGQGEGGAASTALLLNRSPNMPACVAATPLLHGDVVECG